MGIIDGYKFFEFATLGTKKLDDEHASDVLLHEGIEVGNGGADIVETDFDLLFEDICAH